MRRFDVVVVGASIAGCATARLFALSGARVALVEQRPDPAAYKVACTHNVLSSALPAIERLGLGALLDERGAVRTYTEFWTPHGGWIRPPADVPHGYGVTRATLDPMLRELAAATPGVDLLLGQRAVRLLGNGDRISGVEVESPNGDGASVEAQLVVAADGRNSTVARLARMPVASVPTTGSSTSAIGAGFVPGRIARACGSWTPRWRRRSPTRTT